MHSPLLEHNKKAKAIYINEAPAQEAHKT